MDRVGEVPIAVGERSAIEGIIAEWRPGSAVGTIESLGGLTNRIFKVAATGGFVSEAVVVRLPGRGTDAYIDRKAELYNGRIASRVGIGPAILHAARGALVTRFVTGRVLTPALVRGDDSLLERIGHLLGRLHASTSPFLARFDPSTVIDSHRAALDDLVGDVPGDVDALIARLGPLPPPPRLVPCHNDPWPENFIETPERRLCLLDWEYSGMGDPAWDLADLAVEADLEEAAIDALVAAYAGASVDHELRARVERLGPVTDVLWGLWALVQDRDGNQADDFATYGRARLDRAARTLS